MDALRRFSFCSHKLTFPATVVLRVRGTKLLVHRAHLGGCCARSIVQCFNPQVAVLHACSLCERLVLFTFQSQLSPAERNCRITAGECNLASRRQLLPCQSHSDRRAARRQHISVRSTPLHPETRRHHNTPQRNSTHTTAQQHTAHLVGESNHLASRLLRAFCVPGPLRFLLRDPRVYL
jgi:hypothetical protein